MRVRHHDNIARIEVEPKEMELVLQHNGEITEKLLSLGYKYVTLDLQGYQSGSMIKPMNSFNHEQEHIDSHMIKLEVNLDQDVIFQNRTHVLYLSKVSMI